jgi:hypothetical protein
MKHLGSIIAVAGLVGMVYYGYEYMQDSETFSVLGVDVAASTGDYVPILISGIVFLGGLVLRKYLK